MLDSRPLRVAAFLERYLPAGETFIYRQMAGLTRCSVLFLARYRVPGGQHPEQNVHFFGSGPHRAPTGVRWKLRRLRQRVTRRYARLGWRELRRLKAFLLTSRPDLIHAHWAPDAMLAAPLCRALGIPLLVHFHGYDVSRLLHDPVYVASLRRLFGQMTFAITVSEQMRQRLLTLDCPADKVRCHYTGVPDEYFSPDRRQPPKPGRFILLQVGRLAEKKGHRFALAAVAEARSRVHGLVFRIVGHGELRADLQREIVDLGLEPIVQVLGHQDPATVIGEMRRADALILPSCTASDGDAEGLPNVAVEAMASALPVIGTAHAGIPEALRYTEPGWLAPEADAHALQVRIERLASDSELWQRLAEQGSHIARTHFHLPSQNLQMEALYRRLVPSA